MEDVHVICRHIKHEDTAFDDFPSLFAGQGTGNRRDSLKFERHKGLYFKRRDSFQICRGVGCSKPLNLSEELNLAFNGGFGRCCHRATKDVDAMISDEAFGRRFRFLCFAMATFLIAVIGYSLWFKLLKLYS